ncbi:guanine nucleotide-binding protein G(i) subunit alpha-2 [Planoprotostelium fungivorum]|uniref:Guanine nucleotide-binding protein G(I) subunit alpha-2 n=1 Tax=Planoprotostelium fungivorum TaxID=1890364 RepID=A0A2P6NQI8_9EUKA|nr:guanine nucleotide-binding protein G(i) subunit alpha-2 [Planoprotostelium fungivorum]
MGNSCASPSVKSTEDNERINKSLRMDKKKYEEEVRLLLLGAGESGKSTIAKQMKIIHLNGFNESEKASYVETIHYNIYNAMKQMIGATHSLKAAERIMTDHTYFTNLLSPKQAREIARLWEDPSIRAVYKRSSEYQLTDSTEYYMNDLTRVTATDYLPTEQDILRSRVKTTGIIETTFYLEKMYFRWMHCFSEVTAVIFCVALSEYDLKLSEDETVNRMHESLKLFKDVCNSKWFFNTAMILFLNKKDLFQQKIEKCDLNMCFPDYTGGCNYDNAVKFISEKFVQQNENPKKLIYCHQTCATDTKNIETIFNAVNDVLLDEILSNLGIDVILQFIYENDIEATEIQRCSSSLSCSRCRDSIFDTNVRGGDRVERKSVRDKVKRRKWAELRCVCSCFRSTRNREGYQSGWFLFSIKSWAGKETFETTTEHYRQTLAISNTRTTYDEHHLYIFVTMDRYRKIRSSTAPTAVGSAELPRRKFTSAFLYSSMQERPSFYRSPETSRKSNGDSP